MRRTWVLGLWVAVACGGRQTGEDGATAPIATPMPSDPGEPVQDAWRTPAQTETPPIPDFPDLCSRYAIVRSPRVRDQEPRLTCSCAAGSYELCDESSCVTSFSCDALCQSFGELGPTLQECAGDCDVGGDYGGVECVQLPGASKGTFLIGNWCFDDSQCGPQASCTAVTPEGFRMCSPQTTCNTQVQCAPGTRCALPDDSFLGFCGDGRDGSLCFSDADCRTNARCVLGVDSLAPPDRGVCSTGERATSCVEDSDCAVGHCRFSKCSSGEVYDGCHTSSDCQPGLHCQNWGVTIDPDHSLCSDGSVSLHCQRDGDCASDLYCSAGMCQDGSIDSHCDADEECLSGRCQLGGDFPICTSGEPGAGCMDATDCVSGSCVRAPGDFARESGRCD